jgi:hypothetical protein
MNTLLGGWPDETLPSRAWRWKMNSVRKWSRTLIDGLFFFDREHCRESFESERLGRQLPPEARRGKRIDAKTALAETPARKFCHIHVSGDDVSGNSCIRYVCAGMHL